MRIHLAITAALITLLGPALAATARADEPRAEAPRADEARRAERSERADERPRDAELRERERLGDERVPAFSERTGRTRTLGVWTGSDRGVDTRVGRTTIAGRANFELDVSLNLARAFNRLSGPDLPHELKDLQGRKVEFAVFARVPYERRGVVRYRTVQLENRDIESTPRGTLGPRYHFAISHLEHAQPDVIERGGVNFFVRLALPGARDSALVWLQQPGHDTRPSE